MERSRYGEQFLHNKNSELHTSEPVEFEKKQKDKKLWTHTSSKPADKIADWLQVIEKTHLGHRKGYRFDTELKGIEDERVIERIKSYYHKEYVIKSTDIPYSVFLLEQRLVEQLGHGKVEITEEFQQEKIKQIIADQKHSLDRWVDYLSSPDADYPMWAKYWAFTSMVKMGKLEKYEVEEDQNGVMQKVEKARFAKRDKTTVAPFPTMNPNALAKTFSAIEDKASDNSLQKQNRKPLANHSTKLNSEEFKKLLNTENFSKLYTQFLIELPGYSTEGLQETRGEWKVYKKGSQPDELVKSLDGYPLEWCTANKDTAKGHLRAGDFYVYYSIDQDGEANIPRVAIRMQEDKIAEVRGIAPDQNMDPYISDVVTQKMSEFPDGESYKKKSSDMKRVTELEQKTKSGQELDKNDLVFLYEIDSSIEGFGYHKDPRIAELLENRDKNADTCIVFECSPEQIAHSITEFKDDTVAYIGEWSPQVLQNIPEGTKYLYESFPEKKIFKKTIELSTKTAEQYEQELEKAGNKIDRTYALSMLKKIKALPQSEQVDLVQFTVEQLGFSSGATLEEIYMKAKEFNLDLCPPQVGPELRLAYIDQPNGEYLRIAMEPILDSSGGPRLFDVNRYGSGPWLDSYDGSSGLRWHAAYRFVFRIRK